MRNGNLFVRRQRHAVFINRQRNHRSTVTSCHRQHLRSPLLAILQINGVDDRLARNPLQRLLNHIRLGRIDQDWRGYARRHLLDHAVHVRNLVLAHHRAADVQQLRPFIHQPLRHRENAVVVRRAHHLLEVRNPRRRVHLLRDNRGLTIHLQRHHRKRARRHRLRLVLARQRPQPSHSLRRRLDVRRSSPTASTDDIHPILAGKSPMVLGKLRWRQLVDGMSAYVLRQPGIRQHAHGHRRVLAQEPHRVVHLRRPSRAVHPNHIRPEALDHRQRSADLRAQQHRPGRLHRDLHLKRQRHAGISHRVVTGGNRNLHLQNVLAGLDQQHVHAALDQCLRLLHIARQHRVVSDVPQRGQLGRRPHRPRHKSRLLRRRVLARHILRQPRRRNVQFPRAICNPKLGEHQRRCAKRVGLDNVRARLKVARVDLADHIGPRDYQNLRAVLLPREVAFDSKRVVLDRRAHRAVVDQHALLQEFEKCRRCGHSWFVKSFLHGAREYLL